MLVYAVFFQHGCAEIANKLCLFLIAVYLLICTYTHTGLDGYYGQIHAEKLDLLSPITKVGLLFWEAHTCNFQSRSASQVVVKGSVSAPSSGEAAEKCA